MWIVSPDVCRMLDGGRRTMPVCATLPSNHMGGGIRNVAVRDFCTVAVSEGGGRGMVKVAHRHIFVLRTSIVRCLRRGGLRTIVEIVQGRTTPDCHHRK